MLDQISNIPVLNCSDTEDRGSKLLQNSDNYFWTDTVSNSRRLESSLSEPQILHLWGV